MAVLCLCKINLKVRRKKNSKRSFQNKTKGHNNLENYRPVMSDGWLDPFSFKNTKTTKQLFSIAYKEFSTNSKHVKYSLYKTICSVAIPIDQLTVNTHQ